MVTKPKTAPKKTAPEKGGLDEFKDDGLGDAAQSALGDVASGEVQEMLDDTEYTKVRFVGMSFDSLDDDIEIGDEMVFLVRARCTGKIQEASKVDGTIRHIRKMDVQSVVKHSE